MKNSTFCVLIYKIRALVGESMRLFCEDLEIEAIVAEKGDEIPKDCAIYLVCASSVAVAKGAVAELEAQGIAKAKLRWIRTY
ncbi:MAG: hypothetical protein K2N54_06200, partial [Helicobacter sp.]|nr:hypothetical protein [Helicobacter sp.]